MAAKIGLASLLLASALCPSAWGLDEDAAVVMPALELDDQCHGDAEHCALAALQLRAAKSQCDCEWTAGGANCGASDGSECWGTCCSAAVAEQEATGCGNAVWTVAYSPANCKKVPSSSASEGYTRLIACNARSSDQCGTRLSSSVFVGSGLASMAIKAAPGAGVATTFYLSNNGGLYDKMKQHPWVEIDFEIMGHMAGPGQSKIWTNLFTGIAQEHNQWITVPFDVTADYHEFALALSGLSVVWMVDGVVYRTVDIGQFPDVQAAIGGSKLQQFVSVWGKSSKDPGEGIPEFQAGLGKLDQNTNKFPIYAGVKLKDN